MPSKDARREALNVLRLVKEQGLSHACAMEGHVSRYGCDDCTANTEDKVNEAIKLLEDELGGSAG
jgi:hypothetical protein